MKLTSLFAPILVAASLIGASASASTFNLEYEFDTNQLVADIDGDLQADDNTVFVNSVTNVLVNGAAAPALDFVSSYTDFALARAGRTPTTPTPATLTLNGSAVDLIACPDSSCLSGIAFIVGDGTVLPSAISVFGIALQLDNVDFILEETFVSANYALTDVNAVPLPASALLLLAGLGGLGLVRRRRHA